jgi:hypothetical protein
VRNWQRANRKVILGSSRPHGLRRVRHSEGTIVIALSFSSILVSKPHLKYKLAANGAHGGASGQRGRLIYISYSREGAARACLNGVLAKCDRRTTKHLPAPKKVRRTLFSIAPCKTKADPKWLHIRRPSRIPHQRGARGRHGFFRKQGRL